MAGSERTRNPWSPAAVLLGSPGWRQSEAPFCDVHQGDLVGSSVWADARGVFSLVSEACVPRGRDLPSCTPEGRDAEGMTLNFNDGSGWSVLVDEPLWGELRGFEQGKLLSQTADCTILELEPESRMAGCALIGARNSTARRAFTVHPDLAYAISERTLYGFSAGSWSTLVEQAPETLNALWAADSIVYLAGDFGIYSYTPRPGAELRELPNAPAAKYTSAWGFAENDVWFGNSAGQLTHYDGHEFTRVTGIVAEYPAIIGMWGSASVLYFIGATGFGRYLDGRVETLLDAAAPDAPRQMSLWGTSPQDVFLALAEPAFRETPCGSALFLYFDGQEFHRF